MRVVGTTVYGLFGGNASHTTQTLDCLGASPFNKVQGEFVKAKVIAFNGRGQSLASAETSGGVPMETEPHQITTLANGSGTSHLQVEIEWDAPDDGGSTISSYVISWDQGTGDDS